MKVAEIDHIPGSIMDHSILQEYSHIFRTRDCELVTNPGTMSYEVHVPEKDVIARKLRLLAANFYHKGN